MRLHRNALLLAAAVALPSCHEEKVSDVRVMTQNLAIGIELEPVFLAPPAAIPGLVEQAWAQKTQSDFHVRVTGIADAIQNAQPDLVGLQEVIQFFQEVPGTGAGATALVEDFLALLREELHARGLEYDEVVTVTNADIELRGSSGNDYRVVDREAIIARRGLELTNARSGNYGAKLQLLIGGAVPFDYYRGWVAVDVTKDGKTFTFVSTHLDAFDPRVQSAQAEELLAGIVNASFPTILVGDMNADPRDAGWPAYGMLVSPTNGFADVGAELGEDVKTCCRDALCGDPNASLERRVDLVLHSPHFSAEEVAVHGTEPSWMQPGGPDGPLWPSDHAGVSAKLGL